MKKNTRIYVAGHRGMVGSAIFSRLQAEGYPNLVTRTHEELDLTDQPAVQDFFQKERVEYVVLAAAKVGGIHANNAYPAEFIYQNIMIEANVIHEAYRAGVKRLLFLGSSCIYPKEAKQPMKEEYLLTGALEPTNEPYAIAKIAGIKLCEAYNRQYGTLYRAVMPNNLYGPNDNYDLENSHVLPALIRKFHLAQLAARGDWGDIKKDESRFGVIPNDFMACLVSISKAHGHDTGSDFPDFSAVNDLEMLPDPAVKLWGTGNPYREFVHVNDMADACLFVMCQKEEMFDSLCSDSGLPLVNIGYGEDLTIRELATLIADIIGCKIRILWDNSKPDGTMRKLLDTSKLVHLGWKPSISLKEGIKHTYEWYLSQI